MRTLIGLTLAAGTSFAQAQGFPLTCPPGFVATGVKISEQAVTYAGSITHKIFGSVSISQPTKDTFAEIICSLAPEPPYPPKQPWWKSEVEDFYTSSINYAPMEYETNLFAQRSMAAIPEPGSYAMLLVGLTGLWLCRRNS